MFKLETSDEPGFGSCSFVTTVIKNGVLHAYVISLCQECSIYHVDWSCLFFLALMCVRLVLGTSVHHAVMFDVFLFCWSPAVISSHYFLIPKFELCDIVQLLQQW